MTLNMNCTVPTHVHGTYLRPQTRERTVLFGFIFQILLSHSFIQSALHVHIILFTHQRKVTVTQ